MADVSTFVMGEVWREICCGGFTVDDVEGFL